MTITSSQLYALCSHAGCDHKTGRKWLNPANRPRMKGVVAQRLERAASAIGLGTTSPAPALVQDFCAARVGKSLAISHR